MAEYSVTRTHATWKPRISAAHVPYYRCSECGAIISGVDGAVDISMTNDGERSLIFEPPYAHVSFQVSCCGKPMDKLEPIPAEDVADRFKLNYQICGGLNNNAIKVDWRCIDPTCSLRWVSLKTFRGVMTKYVEPKKWPPLVFGLADEDAFAYCDKNPCVECTFRCKSGMELYAYVENLGLVNMPVDRMAVSGRDV